ncbi:MAG: sensor histidine kinase [Rhodospirillaceae bacterium]
MKILTFKSLRLRFLFAAFLWVSIATVVAGLVIAGLYRTHVTAKFHEELEHHLDELVTLADVDAGGNPFIAHPISDPLFEKEGSGYYWQIERKGFKRATAGALGDKALDGRFASGREERAGWAATAMGEVLECGIQAPARGGGPPMRFSIAVERRLLEGALADFNRDLTVSLAVFAALMVIGATIQIQYGLRPARQIADSIERLRQGRTARLPSDVPSEFSAIVTRLNALLDAQAALVQRARVEAGNLAHGLRTPLALIGDEAEQIGGRGDSEAAQFILAQCRKIRRQVDYHMKRASAAGTRVTGYIANIPMLVRQIVSAMERLHAERRLGFTVDIPAGTTVNCDEGDLAEILSNLIDNACKWARGRVTIAASQADGVVTIDILDDGPGIAPEMRTQVFDVGARLDESKAGSGLGLAISRDLARLYGGELELNDGPGGGLLARLRLPEAVAR